MGGVLRKTGGGCLTSPYAWTKVATGFQDACRRDCVHLNDNKYGLKVENREAAVEIASSIPATFSCAEPYEKQPRQPQWLPGLMFVCAQGHLAFNSPLS